MKAISWMYFVFLDHFIFQITSYDRSKTPFTPEFEFNHSLFSFSKEEPIQQLNT